MHYYFLYKSSRFVTFYLRILTIFFGYVIQSYVVYMGAHSHGPDATLEDYNRVTDSHHNFLANFVGRYAYKID